MSDYTNRYRNIRLQGVGAVVNEANKQNLIELYKTLQNIESLEAEELRLIEDQLEDALRCIDNVRNFVGSPEHILGSDQTKHGEIAEQVDVWFQNAWNAIQGNPQVATFEGVGRTAPEDYIVNGTIVQSKYINGANNSLSHVLDHLEKYRNIGFGRDDSYYVIPKDQYTEIQNILSGNVGSYSTKTVRAIQEKVQQIEYETGRVFSEAVRPGAVDYASVQQGKIHQTLDYETQKLEAYFAEQQEGVVQDSLNKKDVARQNAAPNWGKAVKVAGISAGISGSLQFASGIYRKCKEGKAIRNFTPDDWKGIGIDTAKATAEGGISGLAIYGMTNYAGIPSPVAAGAVSLGFGLIELTAAYHNQNISRAEFIEGCQTIGINTVVCTIGAVLGEHLIPIPILGSILGSVISGNVCSEICGNGTYAAVQYASYYVRGTTLSALNSIKQISVYHNFTANNLNEAKRTQNKAETNIDSLLAELGGI